MFTVSVWLSMRPCSVPELDPSFSRKTNLGGNFGTYIPGGPTTVVFIGVLDKCVSILSLSGDLVNSLSKPWVLSGAWHL